MDGHERIRAAVDEIAGTLRLDPPETPEEWRGLVPMEYQIRRLEMLAAGVRAGVKVSTGSASKRKSRKRQPDGDEA